MILEQFHFLHPLWLLALLPLMFIYWLAFQKNTDARAWEKIIDAKLLPLLLQGEEKRTHKLAKFLLAIIWIISVIALADPVWEKVPRPIFQTNAARILVLDLSNSMLIDDLKPSRLARARFKIEDILSREEEGQTGLVLFAGQAFIATPLTRDTETIRSLLKVLTPQIMPSQGSRADLGLVKAHELLKQAGIRNGQVLLIADGVSNESASLKAAEDLRANGHTVSVMAVGTETGGTLNFSNNTSVSVKLEVQSLSKIASNGGGNYHLMTTNNTDLKNLLVVATDNSSLAEKQNESADNEIQNREWHSTGPLLVLLLLPFAALAFRRGWILNIAFACFVLSFLTQPQTVMAAENDVENKWTTLLESLYKNNAQRTNQALIEEKYEKARSLSKNPLSRGIAEYKLADYDAALNSFKQAKGADARYNQGNTLAKLEKYEEAIASYAEALTLAPDLQDAIDNKKAVEDFLKQQQQAGKKNQSSNENQQGNSDSQNDQQNQQSGDAKGSEDKQGDTQSANKEGDKAQEKNKDGENQFSEAVNDLEKNKENAEDDESQASKKQSNKNANEDTAQTEEDKAIEEDSEKQAADQLEQLKTPAEELNKEERMAAEQWLRRIPDDPGGLLRRKFRHQLEQDRRDGKPLSKEQPW